MMNDFDKVYISLNENAHEINYDDMYLNKT